IKAYTWHQYEFIRPEDKEIAKLIAFFQSIVAAELIDHIEILLQFKRNYLNIQFRKSPDLVNWVRLYSTQSNKFSEYEMPSVTWGVVQGRKERLVSKVIICDYLKTLGIITDELEDIELPSTVDVMRERVEFLQKLGLTIDDMNEYPLMLGCSVRKNVIPVLGYLEKVGIPRPKLGEFVKSYPQVLHASVVVELVPVIKFLRGLDVEKEDIGYVLQKYPELLGFKLEGTMSTSVAYLVSIGVNPRDIGPMVTQYPYLLGMRVGTMIKPMVEYLVSLGLPKKILARMFEKRPYIIGYDLEETVKPNVECLISFGVSKEEIPSMIAQYPQILGLPLKAKMSSQQYFFNLKLKIDPEGFARIVERMPQIVSLHQHVLMKPVEFLLARGLAAGDVANMVVRCPQLLASNLGIMKNSYYFFKSEIGRPIRELVEFPEYFTYSLESRIKPRYQRLQSKGIRCSLAWFLNCSDKRFEERLQNDRFETESSGPTFNMGGKLELPGSYNVTDVEDDSEDEVLYRRTVSL
ncbi:Transcription termination factor MTERF4 chloroplastic, partial [Bienertia sinuspersici]